MPVSDYFSASYSEARDKFRAAAQAGGAQLKAYTLPTHRGPSGEELSIDVAIIGSASPRRASNAMGATTFIMALALMLIFEGVLPFIAPTLWRDTFRKITQMTDGQIRFVGLSSMIVGLLLLLFVRA